MNNLELKGRGRRWETADLLKNVLRLCNEGNKDRHFEITFLQTESNASSAARILRDYS